MTPAEWLAAYIDGDAEVRPWYRGPAFDFSGILAERARRGWEPPTAEEMDEWDGWLAAHGAGDQVRARARLFAEPDTLCVATGQQAGLGLGPLYTLHKALATARWAAELERATARPVVPVFWIASDDHDFAEAAATCWLDAEGRPREHRLAQPDGRVGAPIHDLPIAPEQWDAFLADFTGSTRATGFSPELSELLKRAGGTLESHFATVFNQLLGALGIVPVVPRLGFLRRRGAEVFRRELATNGLATTLLAERAAALRERFGLEAIHRDGTELNYFREWGPPGALVRAKAVRSGDGYALTHPASKETLARWSAAELEADLAEHWRHWSPNAATRPLVQDLALPTLGYVAGPGEAVYHAQIGPLYDLLGVPRPAVLPRPSLLLLEPRIERALAKFDLSPTGAAALTPALLESRLSPGGGGAGSVGLAGHLGAALDAWIAELGPDAGDEAVAKGAAKLRDSLAQNAARLEERVAAVRARRADTLDAQRRKVLDALAPFGEPQERRLGLLAPLLLNYGTGAPARLLDSLPTLRIPGRYPAVARLG
ncbi:MAG: bacillithiol biosynthesis BshC [Candidatus Sumerlaeia bacterium]|nr:bacillithiol biosynthesis BshC [Candidatus Sumerlaeia bacterium]